MRAGHGIDPWQERAEAAEKRIEALTEAVVLWRDRPNGDVGLALALAGILDAEQPEPPAATALVRVLRECDRLRREVRGLVPIALAGRRDAVSRILAAASDSHEHSAAEDFDPTCQRCRNGWQTAHDHAQLRYRETEFNAGQTPPVEGDQVT